MFTIITLSTNDDDNVFIKLHEPIYVRHVIAKSIPFHRFTRTAENALSELLYCIKLQVREYSFCLIFFFLRFV